MNPSDSETDPSKEFSASTGSSTSPHVDSSFYTWTALFKGLLGTASQEEIQKYNAVHQHVKKDKLCKACEDSKNWMFRYSPIVRFMREQCRMVGGEIDPSHVRCMPCEPNIMQGGFDPNYGIVLCSNEALSNRQIEDTIAHEMIHAYDFLRWEVDPNNLRHMACTEIRASMLSGECRFRREFWDRKQYKLVRSFQDCVRRRATWSMVGRLKPGRINPSDPEMKVAGEIVESVWDSCFADTRPFDEIYK